MSIQGTDNHLVSCILQMSSYACAVAAEWRAWRPALLDDITGTRASKDNRTEQACYLVPRGGYVWIVA